MEQERRYNILVTGGNGFIGWNFINLLYSKECKLKFNKVVNLDANDYSAINYTSSNYKENYFFEEGRMKDISERVIKQYEIDLIVNFAAHTHVDNSIESINQFVINNVHEMTILAEHARLYWKEKNIDGLFVQVSTDEVFGSIEDQDNIAFNEFSSYHPNNPYAATKASAELILKSLNHTHNFPFIITNCSNNYGYGQHKEKLIPKIVYNCLANKDIPIYGNGFQRRDWIFVEDHCDGIVDAILHGRRNESYLFGTNKTVTNLELAIRICNILDSKLKPEVSFKQNIKFVEDRLGHDKVYQIDYTKSYIDLDWYPKNELEESLEKTVDWYIFAHTVDNFYKKWL